MKIEQCYELMNEWTKDSIPYLFIIDFDQKEPLLYKLSELNRADSPVYYHFPHLNNNHFFHSDGCITQPSIKAQVTAEAKERYIASFNKAQTLMHQQKVDVINLTKSTPLNIEGDLNDIYKQASAKYKVLLKDKFVCCTPEIFIRIDQDGNISTYPMKGTIDANIPNAQKIIIENEKEEQEHRATANLLVEELKHIAQHVEIKRYRYLDRLTTSDKDLYQVSSEVVGDLIDNYKTNLGDLFKELLPAGSILGSPKEAAHDVIRAVEEHTRGYYTGICGIFDGTTLDSCVLIRFIEKDDLGYCYKSGGGITLKSNGDNEYQETLNKIYVPLD